MKPQKPGLFRQLLLAATLAGGFAPLWLLAALIAGSIIVKVRAGPETDWPPISALVIRSDGTPLIKSTPRTDPATPSYRDLNGASVPSPPENEIVEGHYLTGEAWARGYRLLDGDWPTRLKTFADPQDTDVMWYFIHDGAHNGAGYFAGYKRSTSALLGFIGETGWRSDRPPQDEQIPVKSTLLMAVRVCDRFVINEVAIRPGWVYVPSGNRLRLVDLSARTVRTAFDAREPIESFAFCAPHAGKSANLALQAWLVVRTLHAIVVLNGDHEVMRTFAIPEKWQRAEIATWYFLRDSRALVEFDQPWQHGETRTLRRRRTAWLTRAAQSSVKPSSPRKAACGFRTNGG